MIEAKDIRIGNWVCAEGNQWGIVSSVASTIMVNHALNTRVYHPEQLSPIKMTRDILPLCGFEIFDAGYRHKESFYFLKYLGEGDVILEIAGESKKLSYVHQLQNLHFDIAGKLLEPNLYGN